MGKRGGGSDRRCGVALMMRMHPLLRQASRPERRRVLSAEQHARATGEWGTWEELNFPPGTAGSGGWAAEITRAHRNKVFAVLERDAPGGVTHLAVSSMSTVRPSWPEMQRIKNELAGSHRTAVEVYPPQAQVIDEADMYHIWILPEGLKFGLHDEEEKS
jgi:hypothetical protein